MIELTEQQRRVLDERGGPVEFLDPATRRTYVLIAAEQYQRVRGLLEGTGIDPLAIPPGVKKSQEAFWRDLAGLLRQKKNQDQWVAYHGDERVGIARLPQALLREIRRREIPNGAYYLAVIRPREVPPWEAEEGASIHPHHFEDPPAS